MRGSLYLAWQYLRYQRWKTLLLIAAITLVFFLPAGLQVLVQQGAEQLTARAAATPLIVGAKGSELELVLNTLYFESRRPPTLPFSAVERVRDTGLAVAIPMYARFAARGRPIVGTSVDYFEFRKLRLASGRMLSFLGECVLGAQAARALQLQSGDSLISSPETFFDLAGVYPLKMHVVGVLQPSGTADDRVVFVDVKTAWIMEGLGHGHQDLTDPDAASQLLQRDSNEVTANASVLQYTEITRENALSFHFHGDRSAFPLTAVIAQPRDQKAETLLLGKFRSPTETTLIVKPREVMEQLVRTVFTIRKYIIVAGMLVAISTLLCAGLIFLLSVKLRQREIETMLKLGASRGKIISVLVCEIVLTLACSSALAAALTYAASYFSDWAIRLLIL
jgi:putative ABC transport system permease protein